jgi:hypothetical protein
MDEKREMLELFAVPDVFVSGLGSVEDMGSGNVRFTLFSEQEIDGHHELVVTLRFVMSLDAVPEAMHMTALGTHTCACQNARMMTRN